jgi:hypothetical protein
MKKQVLASSIAAVFVAAFMVPSLSTDSFAQVSSESRVLQAILALTEVIKGQTDDLSDTLTNVEEDLLFKKKFWQFHEEVPISGSTGQSGWVGVYVVDCSFDDLAACAFNVESIQISSNSDPAGVNITDMRVDGVETVLTNAAGFELQSPSNVMVDSGLGKVGASDEVAVRVELNISTSGGFVEFNGEKPQGMELCLFVQTTSQGPRVGLTDSCER